MPSESQTGLVDSKVLSGSYRALRSSGFGQICQMASLSLCCWGRGKPKVFMMHLEVWLFASIVRATVETRRIPYYSASYRNIFSLFDLVILWPYEDANTGMILLSPSKNEDLRFRKIIQLKRHRTETRTPGFWFNSFVLCLSRGTRKGPQVWQSKPRI